MFISVHELELRKIGFESAFAPGALDFGDAQLRQQTALEVTGSAELLAPIDEIRVHGHIRGRLASICDRCLEPVLLPVDGDFDLVYMPAGMEGERTEEHAIQRDDTEVGFYNGAGIELGDVVLEQVLLWLPMHRLCREDCKGICQACGQNRNQTDCGCHPVPADERWDALKKLSGV